MSVSSPVITGIGVVAPNGVGKDTFWQAQEDAHSSVDRVNSFSTDGLSVNIAAQVRDFDLPQGFHDIVPDARCMRYARILADPYPPIDAAAQVFSKVTVNMAADIAFVLCYIDTNRCGHTALLQINSDYSTTPPPVG